MGRFFTDPGCPCPCRPPGPWVFCLNCSIVGEYGDFNAPRYLLAEIDNFANDSCLNCDDYNAGFVLENQQPDNPCLWRLDFPNKCGPDPGLDYITVEAQYSHPNYILIAYLYMYGEPFGPVSYDRYGWTTETIGGSPTPYDCMNFDREPLQYDPLLSQVNNFYCSIDVGPGTSPSFHISAYSP